MLFYRIRILLLSLLYHVVVVAEKTKIINTSDSGKSTIVDSNNNSNNISGNGDNKKILVVKSIPGYPGLRSDVYEIYMEPYDFQIGIKAIAEIKDYEDNGTPKINGPKGKIMLKQLNNGIEIIGTIKGLDSGLYRLYINEKGQLYMGCKSSGMEYNPYTVTNKEGPHNKVDPLQNFGYLGDIRVDNDKNNEPTEINMMNNYLTISGVRGAVGRTLVIEKIIDNENQERIPEIKYVACGIIGYA
ncbi:superoxide dismutase [Cu-Zn]-like isoform X2 [Microplitis mediator]|uniref:superoxide dismutase [Cu-Zn]-like isoform X2 n=1 Tax=Microplitis mediator TaxID=375433 RepID=UPI00255772A9|nr:superoxide dismutase [Cu-Zn]-like isoform X2 [Microplitis mediator]